MKFPSHSVIFKFHVDTIYSTMAFAEIAQVQYKSQFSVINSLHV